MILIFDLDDTLYDEITYVMSGLKAVAKFGEEFFGLNAETSNRFMQKLLYENGRGRIFNDWLASHGLFSKKNVKKCLHIYRHHDPQISLSAETKAVLSHFRDGFPLYLVTDGHKIVQKNKVNALKIDIFFERVFITHNFGIRNAKPSLHCFELIKRAEKCNWDELVYVGDNPTKDFVNLNYVGAKTIRVLTGSYSKLEADRGYDAQVSIPNLQSLDKAIQQFGLSC
jgi:putative hydrolase of the HAD superfamily